MKKYCVIGQKLSHSLSPFIHNKYFQTVGINAEYGIMELSEEAIKSRDFCDNLHGFNVTVPYKKTVISLLDALSKEAKYIGAVNTVKRIGDRLFGYNSDPFGFGYMLDFYGINATGKNVLVLGNGGACKSVVFSLQSKGADKIYVASRSMGECLGAEVVDYDAIKNIKADIVVNTTPLGMFPNVDSCPIDEPLADNYEVFVDIVYNPSYTQFCKLGASKAKLAINGLYMLVAQAIKSQEIWQDCNIDRAIIGDIFRVLKVDYHNKNKGNIYLTGIMSCGKSTIGAMLAEQMSMNFVDMDDYIVKISNRTIAELFEEGEQTFREWESIAVYELSLLKNTVIACGGGVVKNQVNVATMSLSGSIIWIERDINKIVEDAQIDTRPLLKDGVDVLFEIYEQRKDLYCNSCDIRLNNDKDAQSAVDKIRKIMQR